MKEDALRGQSVSSTDHDLSLSRQTSLAAPETSSWSGGSVAMDPFEFCPAPSDGSIPSFDPAIAAFADLSFTQQPPNNSMPEAQPADGFQTRDSHDKKRVKVETETPALDSIDYWISFDDDLERMGSFEIDYSKRPDLLNQNRPASESIPGLGSGLYNTTTAPFRDEDFFDDSAFDQVLSDDEEMFESAAKQKGPSPQQTSQQTSPLAPQLSYGTSPDLSRSQGPERFPIGSSQPSTSKNAPRQTGIVTTAQTPEYDEQRRFLEDALNSGRIPAALLPPNGFGIGFGAGMGGFRQPQEFDTKSVSPPKKTSGTPDKPTLPKGSDGPDESETKRHIKKASTVKTGPAKKTAGPGAPKARSADRIAHNDVERKYRTNLKHRIAELRASVPALQTSGAEGDAEGAGGGSGNAKISKGAVLTKATEYIHQLELRNKSIMQEHQQLARRLQAFETLLNSTGRQTDLMMPNHSMTLFDPRGFC